MSSSVLHSEQSQHVLKVCFLTDNKPGHKNQLLGLEQSLSAKIKLESCWLDVSAKSFSLLSALKMVDAGMPFKPDLIVGAGRKTQFPLWVLKKKLRCFSVLLMRPSILPRRCFDALVIPKHDNPTEDSRVFRTTGVLNKIRPSYLAQPSRRGLILIGGISKHYHWRDADIIDQLKMLISGNHQIDQWVIGDSRRTPSGFRELVEELLGKTVCFMPVEHSSAEWLPEQMSCVDQIWVTPDSVSMVYESLSSGRITGLFDMSATSVNRIVKGINELVQARLVLTVSKMNQVMKPSEAFCEADRVADWLVSQLGFSESTD